MVKGIKLRHRTSWFYVASAQSISYVMPTLSLSQLWIVLQLMEDISVQQLYLKGNSNMNRHGLMLILRYYKVLVLLSPLV
jgi:hypothetical protein